MEKIIERTKFAIVWRKADDNRIAEEKEKKDKQGTRSWAYAYSYDIPSCVSDWLRDNEKIYGLQRIAAVIRILAFHRIYMKMFDGGLWYGDESKKNTIRLLNLFCGIPRSLKSLAVFPNAFGVIAALPKLCKFCDDDPVRIAEWFSKDKNAFWEELSGYREMDEENEIKNVFFLMSYLAPDEILKIMRQECWRVALENTLLEEDISFSVYPNRTVDEIAEYYRTLFFTPAIRMVVSGNLRKEMAKVIVDRPGAAQYFNWIFCNKKLRDERITRTWIDMALVQEAPNVSISYLKQWNLTDETQIARILQLIAYSNGEQHFLRRLDRFVSEHTSEELDQLLSRPLTSVLLEVCGRKSFSGKWESRIEPIGLDDEEFAGPNFITKAIVKNHKAVLRYLKEDLLDEETIQYLCKYKEAVRNFAYLNAWSPKDINAMVKKNVWSRIISCEDCIVELGEKFAKLPPYTYQELTTMQKICMNSKGYRGEMEIFFMLLGKLRSETACRRMGQFATHCNWALSDEEIKNAATTLMRYDLPTAAKMMFRIPVSTEIVARAICASTESRAAFLEATTETECIFAVENPELCKNSLKDGMRQFMTKDETVLAVKKALKIPDEFYEEYQDHVQQFFLNGGGQYAKAYMTREVIVSPFTVVMKAAMSGKLPELRYTDLDKECCMDIPESMLKVWTTDQDRQIDGFEVYEDTSFNGIMKMGAVPTRTCMNYADGMYRECLLAYFDGNKKIVYVKKNGAIIGRAVIRLTKTVNHMVDKNKSLAFTDVTADTHKQHAKAETPVIETPVLFLERCYSGVQAEGRIRLEAALIQFIAEKAKEAGCGLVVAKDYMELSLKMAKIPDLKSAHRFVFITKSKAGDQYLDSFGGVYSNKKYDRQRENVFVKADCYCNFVNDLQ